MNERDELIEDFRQFLVANYPCKCEAGADCDAEREEAEALVRTVEIRGYSKPRTITTAEELDALPVDSVVRTSNGHVYEKGCFPDDEEFPFWAATGEPRVFPGRRVPLPVTLLWEPR